MLEHEPDPPRAERGQRPVRQAVDPFTRDRDLTARRPIQRPEHVEQRRLAGPRRPDDREQLAGVDLEVDVAQRVHGRLTRVPAPDPTQLDDPVRRGACERRGFDGGRHRATTTAIPSASPSPRIST